MYRAYNLGILILKLATKQNGRHFHNFYPSFRAFHDKSDLSSDRQFDGADFEKLVYRAKWGGGGGGGGLNLGS